MNDVSAIALSPEVVLGEMKKNGVTHVVWLPDSGGGRSLSRIALKVRMRGENG